jgi:uncharacterized protein (DUF2132 family)
MSKEINYENNPLHGVGLEQVLTEIIEYYGFEILFAYLNLNCFKTNPSIKSSLKFLKKNDWARDKVEGFYLYQFKSLPRASADQFELPPRERIVPDWQKPGLPRELSLEDADRLRKKRAQKAMERGQGKRGPQQDNRENSAGSGWKMDRTILSDLSNSITGMTRQAKKMKNKIEKAIKENTPDHKMDEFTGDFLTDYSLFCGALEVYKPFLNAALRQATEETQQKGRLVEEAIEHNTIRAWDAYDELLDLLNELYRNVHPVKKRKET